MKVIYYLDKYNSAVCPPCAGNAYNMMVCTNDMPLKCDVCGNIIEQTSEPTSMECECGAKLVYGHECSMGFWNGRQFLADNRIVPSIYEREV